MLVWGSVASYWRPLGNLTGPAQGHHVDLSGSDPIPVAEATDFSSSQGVLDLTNICAEACAGHAGPRREAHVSTDMRRSGLTPQHRSPDGFLELSPRD